jgi:NADH:ubiquinone oxidoreductase subunit 6 (subunit J)
MSEHQPKPNEPEPIQAEEVKQRERGLNVGLLVLAIVLAAVVIVAAVWYFRTRPAAHAQNSAAAIGSVHSLGGQNAALVFRRV